MDQWIFQITYLDTIGLDGNEAVKKKGALDRPIDTGLAQRGVTESKKKKSKSFGTTHVCSAEDMFAGGFGERVGV